MRLVSRAIFYIAVVFLTAGWLRHGVLLSPASLTIQSAALDASGKILTLSIAGASGSVTPASGVTGITVHYDSTTLGLINSATATGSTVTVTLDAFVLQGTSPTVDIGTSATSNLTDAAHNTPTGQSGVAVTNNSAQTATSVVYTNTNLYFFGGPPATVANLGGQGRNAFGWGNTSSNFLETVTVGSSVRALVIGGYGNVSITVDGGAPVAYNSLPFNKWVWVNVYSGLTDGPHGVKILAPYYDQTTLLSVLGSVAAVQKPAHYGTLYQMNNAAVTEASIIDGYYATNTSVGAVGEISWQFQNGALRFQAAITDLYIWAYERDGRVILYQDGVEIRSVPTLGNNNVWDLINVANGLDGTSHTYNLLISSDVMPSFLSEIMVTGTGFIPATLPSTPDYEAWYGDSITGGQGLGLNSDGRLADDFIVSSTTGRFSWRAGSGGQKVSIFGRDNTAQVCGVSPLPKRVWDRWGHNDVSVTPIGAVGSPGTFMGDYYTMLTNLRSQCGVGVPIVVEEIFPCQCALTTYNAAIVTVVNQFISDTGATNIRLVPTIGWFNPTTDTVDGTHPNALGYAKMANREIPLAAAAGYTASGPSSGVHGVPSTAFTVTIATGATFTGDQTVTISDGGAGGTITPSVGSPGTSSVTVTPTNGATSFTFTYNAASSGAKTLTITNGQVWFDPTPLSFTAS